MEGHKNDKSGYANTTIEVLCEKDVAEVMDLFCRCFFCDHYYCKMFPDEKTKIKTMDETFHKVIYYCISKGHCLGVKKNEKILGFIICFDYKKVRDTDNNMFRLIFSGDALEGPLPYESALHDVVSALHGKTIYCLSLAVDPAFRRLGIASALWDCMMATLPDCSFATDISNSFSLEIYRRRNFHIQLLDNDYYLATCNKTQRS